MNLRHTIEWQSQGTSSVELNQQASMGRILTEVQWAVDNLLCAKAIELGQKPPC